VRIIRDEIEKRVKKLIAGDQSSEIPLPAYDETPSRKPKP
jgi:hypothetical protein